MVVERVPVPGMAAPPMPVVDRVAHLRRVGLFAATPGRVLAGIAPLLEEVFVPAGEVLIEEGAVEDWLFIVTDGEAEVVRRDRRVRVGAGEALGELSLLDAKPRSATVLAATDLRGFRLARTAFDLALETRPEVARGVIQMLLDRLRERDTS